MLLISQAPEEIQVIRNAVKQHVQLKQKACCVDVFTVTSIQKEKNLFRYNLTMSLKQDVGTSSNVVKR